MSAPAGRHELASGRLGDVAAAILLGGASARMGADKARLRVAGEAAVTRLARRLEPLFEELLLVGGTPPAEAPGRRVADPPGPVCALRGLVGALSAARAERVLVVATDLLGLGPELPLALVAWPPADVVLPRRAGRPEPLCALWRRAAALEPARARLAAGELALHGLLAALDCAYLEEADLAALDPRDLALANVNDPAALAAFAAASGLAVERP